MVKASGIQKLPLNITRNFRGRGRRKLIKAGKENVPDFSFLLWSQKTKENKTQERAESSFQTHQESQHCCEEESTSMDEGPQKNIGSFLLYETVIVYNQYEIKD